LQVVSCWKLRRRNGPTRQDHNPRVIRQRSAVGMDQENLADITHTRFLIDSFDNDALEYIRCDKAQTANGAQVAQSGERCASYGKANNCAARWDRRTKACTCVG
jgi:hypothetical protein